MPNDFYDAQFSSGEFEQVYDHDETTCPDCEPARGPLWLWLRRIFARR